MLTLDSEYFAQIHDERKLHASHFSSAPMRARSLHETSGSAGALSLGLEEASSFDGFMNISEYNTRTGLKSAKESQDR